MAESGSGHGQWMRKGFQNGRGRQLYKGMLLMPVSVYSGDLAGAQGLSGAEVDKIRKLGGQEGGVSAVESEVRRGWGTNAGIQGWPGNCVGHGDKAEARI